MRTITALTILIILLTPIGGNAQDSRAVLESAAQAMGATNLRSIEYTATGSSFSVGQSTLPGNPYPRFTVKSYTRSVNYETGASREDAVRQRADAQPRGGGVPAMGEARQIFVVRGDRAWNVVGDAVNPTPVALTERQFQLWATPHGVIKAAARHGAVVQGRTISFTIPGQSRVRATLDAQNLVEKVEAAIPNAVLGDAGVEIVYSDYRDFGGVKFPLRIRQSVSGAPSLDLTVSDVRPNATVDIAVPDAVRDATNPYARVTSQKVADGVWYLTGGTHHSVVIEMSDHVVLAESPLDDNRAAAVIAETRTLAPGKPIRYVIASHNHFDHTGGLRAVAAEGATIIMHESSRPYFDVVLSQRGAANPDRMSMAGGRARVEGVQGKRVLSDGTRSVEIHHIAGNLHSDDLLMVYLPRERLLIEADVFTPLAQNAPPPSAVNPNTVNLADNISRLGLSVDQILPLHGRMVPLAELNRTIGR